MPKARDIYLLSPSQLRPEVIAVAFAKTSRSPESFREIAAGLTDESSSQFHERWVVGYGHASVAEHAVLHLAFENVSRLAIEVIESNRLASYTEKSTRYQVFERDGYYTPEAIARSRHADRYRRTIAQLFNAYFESIEPVRAVVASQFPRKADEDAKKYDARLRSKYIDNCRFLLPAATLANVGMTANARVLENAIKKMLSHPLQEVREIGAEVKRVSQAEVPTLVKYAEASEYLEKISNVKPPEEGGCQPSNDKGTGRRSNECLMLVDYDGEAEERFAATCLYRHGGLDYVTALQRAQVMSGAELDSVVRNALSGIGDFDTPLRELEHITLTFDCLLDWGAWYELKRHRMMTLTPQPLDIRLGFAMPRVFEEAGLGTRFRQAMNAAAGTLEMLAADLPSEAGYIFPNAFNRRVLITLNLREAFHFCKLRSAPNAHFSIRRIAMRMYELIREVYPTFASFMRCDEMPSSEQLTREFFANVE
jgi:thymidylate synthase ThyX